MGAWAMYRLPFADQYTVVEQSAECEALPHIADLEGKSGFVMIPFSDQGEHPVLLIHPDRVLTHAVASLPAILTLPLCTDNQLESAQQWVAQSVDSTTESVISPAYSAAFDRFHRALCDGCFDKLVLSRSQTLAYAQEEPTSLQMQSLFHRACLAYPRMMVYLACVGREYWLGCTPEILLDGSRSHFRTVALAGTMRADAEAEADRPALQWDGKNRREQAIVANYIRQVLQPMADVIEEEGPYTSRAGNLLHLKTEFHFAPSQPFELCRMIGQLHPTPAVCGLPKCEARQFILANEGYDRSYYSGVVGMLQPEAETHLYVNLRCARFDAQGAHLYVGGGILSDSTLPSEWQETRAKMQTISSLLLSS